MNSQNEISETIGILSKLDWSNPIIIILAVTTGALVLWITAIVIFGKLRIGKIEIDGILTYLKKTNIIPERYRNLTNRIHHREFFQVIYPEETRWVISLKQNVRPIDTKALFDQLWEIVEKGRNKSDVNLLIDATNCIEINRSGLNALAAIANDIKENNRIKIEIRFADQTAGVSDFAAHVAREVVGSGIIISICSMRILTDENKPIGA